MQQKMKSSRSKRFRASAEAVRPIKVATTLEAVKVLQSLPETKFDQSFELHLNLSVDPKNPDHALRGVVALPNGTGKKVHITAIARGQAAEDARAAGADVVGAEEVIEQIASGKWDTQWCVATPDMMPLLGKVAKILGPRGLMPNPKLGTVTTDMRYTVSMLRNASPYRVDKNGIIHMLVGKQRFSADQVRQNIHQVMDTLMQVKPVNIKGTFIKSAYLSLTMSPSIMLDVADLLKPAA